MFENVFLGVLPEVYLGSIILFFLCLLLVNNKKLFVLGVKPFVVEDLISVLFSLLGSLLVLFFILSEQSTEMGLLLDFSYLNDHFIKFSKMLILVIFGLFLFMTFEQQLRRDNEGSFDFLILLFISLLGIFFMVSSCDYKLTFISVELQSLTFYILVSYRRYMETSAEAGLKYFLYGSISSISLLYGIYILYDVFGTTNIMEQQFLVSWLGFFLPDVAGENVEVFLNNFGFLEENVDFFVWLLSKKTQFLFGILFIFLAFMLKLGIFPFYLWLIDVYSGVSLRMMAFLSLVPKSGYFLFFLRLFILNSSFWFFSLNLNLIDIPGVNLILEFFCLNFKFFFFFSGLFSIIFGNFGALGENRIQKVFAYSGVAHMGYVFLGFFQDFIILSYSLAYFVMYLVLLVVFFGFILNIFFLSYFNNELKVRVVSKLNFNFIYDFIHLSKGYGLLTFLVIFNLFSFSGIPPSSGFFAKLLVIVGMSFNGLYDMMFFVLFLTVLGSVYYIRMVMFLFFYVKVGVPSVFLWFYPSFSFFICLFSNISFIYIFFFNLFTSSLQEILFLSF